MFDFDDAPAALQAGSAKARLSGSSLIEVVDADDRVGLAAQFDQPLDLLRARRSCWRSECRARRRPPSASASPSLAQVTPSAPAATSARAIAATCAPWRAAARRRRAAGKPRPWRGCWPPSRSRSRHSAGVSRSSLVDPNGARVRDRFSYWGALVAGAIRQKSSRWRLAQNSRSRSGRLRHSMDEISVMSAVRCTARLTISYGEHDAIVLNVAVGIWRVALGAHAR